MRLCRKGRRPWRWKVGLNVVLTRADRRLNSALSRILGVFGRKIWHQSCRRSSGVTWPCWRRHVCRDVTMSFPVLALIYYFATSKISALTTATRHCTRAILSNGQGRNCACDHVTIWSPRLVDPKEPKKSIVFKHVQDNTDVMPLLSKQMRLILQEQKTNERVLNKAKVKRELLHSVKARKLAYCGHTTRKQGSCLERETDNARNNVRCTQARKITHDLDEQHQYVD